MKIRTNLFLVIASLFMSFSFNEVHKQPNAGIETSAIDESNSLNKVRKSVLIRNEEVDYSRLYVQKGENDGFNYLRYAIAVKGKIDKITFNLVADKLDGEDNNLTDEKNVETLYKGIIANGETKYYNPSSYDTDGLTSDTFYAGNYYWACYTVKYTSDRRNDSNVSITVKINDEIVSAYTNSLNNIIDDKMVSVSNYALLSKIGSTTKVANEEKYTLSGTSAEDYLEIVDAKTSSNSSDKQMEISNLRTSTYAGASYQTYLRNMHTQGQKVRFHVYSDYAGYADIKLLGCSNIIDSWSINKLSALQINDAYKISRVVSLDNGKEVLEQINITNDAIFPERVAGENGILNSTNIFINALNEVTLGNTLVTKGENVFELEVIWEKDTSTSGKYYDGARGFNTGANIMGLSLMSAKQNVIYGVDKTYKFPSNTIKLLDEDEAIFTKYAIDSEDKITNFKGTNLESASGDYFEFVETKLTYDNENGSMYDSKKTLRSIPEVYYLNGQYNLRNFESKGQKIRFHIYSDKAGLATLSLFGSSNLFDSWNITESYDFNIGKSYKLSMVETNANNEERLVELPINDDAIFKGVEKTYDDNNNPIVIGTKIYTINEADLCEVFVNKDENIFELEVTQFIYGKSDASNYNPAKNYTGGANIAGMKIKTK